MFELMYQQMQISYAEKINRFIYTIKRIPFFGKYIPEELYARISLKRTIAVFIGILSLIEDIFYKFIYFFGAVLMEVIIIAAKLEEDKFVFDEAGIMIFWIFFFMNFLLGSFVNSRICACDENDYLMVGLLRIDARRYFLIKMFKSQITQIIYYTVFMLVAQHIFDGNIKTTLLYMSGFAAFRFIGEALRLYLNDRFGMPFTDKNKVLNVLYNAYVGIMLLAAYGIPFILLFTKYVLEYNVAVFPDISVIAANPVFLTAAFMLAIASIRYIVTYKNYPLVAKRLAGFNTIMQQKTVAEDVSKVNKDVEADDLTEKETGKRIFEEKVMPMSKMFEEFNIDISKIRSEEANRIYEERSEPYVVTNNIGINGASVILYPDMLREIAAKLGGDFYVLPSSIHEVLVVSASEDVDEKSLKKMVEDINRNYLLPDEYLSDNVYKYNLIYNSLEMIA